MVKGPKMWETTIIVFNFQKKIFHQIIGFPLYFVKISIFISILLDFFSIQLSSSNKERGEGLVIEKAEGMEERGYGWVGAGTKKPPH